MRLLVQSNIVSLLLHTVALIVLCALPRLAIERVILAGRQHVISLQPSVATPATIASLTQEASEVPLSELSDEQSIEPPEPPSDAQRERAIQERREAKAPGVSESPTLAPRLDWIARRVPPAARLPRVPDTVLTHRRRAVAQLFTPAAADVTPLEQLAGVTEKQAVDLSQNPPPKYPAEAVQSRWEGTVLLRLHIDAAGRVTQVAVEQSSGHGVLDRAAIEAVRQWQGQPARQNGRAVASQEILPIRFRL